MLLRLDTLLLFARGLGGNGGAPLPNSCAEDALLLLLRLGRDLALGETEPQPGLWGERGEAKEDMDGVDNQPSSNSGGE